MRSHTFPVIALLAAAHVCHAAAPAIPYDTPTPLVAPTPVVDARTVALLDAALAAETDSARKSQLLADLARCPLPAADAPIARAFADADPLVRAGAARAALQRAPELARQALTKLAGDASPVVRVAIAGIAGRTGDDNRVAGYVTDNDPAVVAAAVANVCGPASEAAVKANFDKLPPYVQAVASARLGERKAVDAAGAIARLLESDRPSLRVAAIRALAAMSAITRPQIESQLAHPAAAVRATAASGAASLADAEARYALATRAVRDADPAVRAAAVVVIGPIARSESVAVVSQQLATDYAPLRFAARDALVAAAANTSLCDAVIANAAGHLTDASADRRIDGSYVLGALKSNASLDAHTKLLEDADWTVVAQAARSLAAINDAAAAPALKNVVDRARVVTGEIDPEQAAARSDAGEQAILGCVAAGYADVLASTRGIYLDRKSDVKLRVAGLYALGTLGKPADVTSPVRAMIARRTDPEESPDVIAAAMKAAGNAGLADQKSSLASIRTDAASMPLYKYAAHLALDRLNGTSTPFAPEPSTDAIPTSVQAITPAAN